MGGFLEKLFDTGQATNQFPMGGEKLVSRQPAGLHVELNNLVEGNGKKVRHGRRLAHKEPFSDRAVVFLQNLLQLPGHFVNVDVKMRLEFRLRLRCHTTRLETFHYPDTHVGERKFYNGTLDYHFKVTYLDNA